MTRILAIVIATATLLSLTAGPAIADTGFQSWEPNSNGWSGRGETFFPGGAHFGPGPDRDCGDCQWKVYFVCNSDSPPNCDALSGCPAGAKAGMIEDVADGKSPWESHCFGSGPPVSREELGRHVRSRVSQLAPKADPGFQPAKNALTQVPTIFWSGQQKDLDRNDTIAGIPVNFQANAHWSWNWGDNTQPTATTKPGRDWPDKDITHTYRRPGKTRVTLTTTWEASFTVNGVGPFPVTGDPVTQTTTFTVNVKEARAVLITS